MCRLLVTEAAVWRSYCIESLLVQVQQKRQFSERLYNEMIEQPAAMLIAIAISDHMGADGVGRAGCCAFSTLFTFYTGHCWQ